MCRIDMAQNWGTTPFGFDVRRMRVQNARLRSADDNIISLHDLILGQECSVQLVAA